MKHHCFSVKIEDILPFFPDFVTIDHFKSAIVDSLQEYSKHIADLKVSYWYLFWIRTTRLGDFLDSNPRLGDFRNDDILMKFAMD
jgi:hypothetical protein